MDLTLIANITDPISLDPYSCLPTIEDSDYSGFGQ